MGGILLRKKVLVRQLDVTQGGGEIKTDRVALPGAALVVTGIKAIGRHVKQSALDLTTLEFIFGTSPQASSLGQDDLSAMNFEAYQSLTPHFTVSAPTDSGLYIYYAHPSSLADPTFSFQGFSGGFIAQGVLTLDTPKGVQTYRVWRSTNANLGEQVTVTANHQ